MTWTVPLNYPGDRRNFDPDYLVGPNGHGEYYRPVSAEYDAESDRTTIEYELVKQ